MVVEAPVLYRVITTAGVGPVLYRVITMVVEAPVLYRVITTAGFIVLAVIFILLQGVTIGLWLSVRTKADLWLRGKMLDLLKNYAGPEATDSTSNGWNILFMKARCCGVNAQYENGGTNDDFTELPTTWTPSGTDKLPASCCQGASTSTVSTYVSSSTCTQTPSNFYTEGCYSRVKHYIDTYSLVTIIAAGSGIMVELLETKF
ncbi:hypothetical protein MAR_020603 [Mya arenaria]|uniref:Tetraspanin n=1 Tax=Mya arenaria TaxID=6604 RepID=A0ABY7E7Q2_MYAAR|nr:hypothetical protein MAR_020603 [Mya arenaria]